MPSTATCDASRQRAAEVDHEDPLYSERRALRLTTASSTIAGAATVAIFTVALFVALAQFNISLGPLLAGAGIAGVALGFGAQNIVRDVLAGIFVIVEDQYGIGDVIDVGRASGTVESISLRMTRVRDIEGTLWFIPNGSLTEVGNKTQRWARVILDVDVAYGADHHEASRLIKEAADEMWNDPDSAVRLLEEPELWGVEIAGRVLRVDPRRDQERARGPVGRCTRVAGPDQGPIRRGGDRDPLPPAHACGSATSTATRDAAGRGSDRPRGNDH